MEILGPVALAFLLSAVPAVSTVDEYRPVVREGRRLMLSEATVGELVERLSERGSGRAVVTLPVAGSWQSFEVEPSGVLPAGLAARFPRIRAFRGRGVDDPETTVRFELTPRGLSARIQGRGAPIVIEPRSGRGVEHQSRIASTRSRLRSGEQCQTLDHPTKRTSARAARATGESLRTFRIAISSAAEFTQLHGGTVEAGLAAVTTVVNRANEIFESEFAISMQLVEGNDRLIHTNPDTDPFTISDFLVMMDQNQSHIDSVIGDSNYDIGHVFGGRSGGVAAGQACVPGQKARALSNDSRGDLERFSVVPFAHEIGHQFAAGHTFNSVSGQFCPLARFPDQAFEPGSGSTIMSYAGLCEGENVQSGPDDYFHAGTFDRVVDYISQGPGAGCGTTTALANLPPDVDAGPDRKIPSRTPFRLAGAAVDPDQDLVTYTWEQFDLGSPSPPLTDDGERPLFRSFPPSPSAERFFPQLDDLRRRQTSVGETLPTKKRKLTMRLTARDGRGGVASDTAVMRVIKKAGPFAVVSPRSRDEWTVGDRVSVEWDVARTDKRPIFCESVEVGLSTDGGRSVATMMLASTPNDGAQTLTVPEFPTEEARVVISCNDNVFFAMSPRNFTIRN